MILNQDIEIIFVEHILASIAFLISVLSACFSSGRIPSHIPRPPYVKSKKPPGIASGPEVHDEKGIECMRASGKACCPSSSVCWDFSEGAFLIISSLYMPVFTSTAKFHLSSGESGAVSAVEPGITTDEIDQAVHQMIIDNGAYPSPLGYGGFQRVSRVLEDGDIINIDVTVYLNIPSRFWVVFNAFTYSTDCDVQGYHGDTSATYFVGEVDEEARNLVKVTTECLDKAISICAPGVEFNKIGKTIHDHADKHHYGVVQQFVGHGVGRVFHSDPVVLHYRNNGRGRMVLNQTFTIEPMLTIGSINPIMWDDNWTVVTEDGSLSAQFEHTILITNDGAEILTQC
ncbi:hypothetical protein DH2020_037271 [Rehmannia glutinosa]|uniref:Peptidase M24 domain-containing protein n=1 Tax=Rehmannia glutinosa TaxID=99300 RepID=A0ABR0V2I8_REHGL